MGKYVPDDASGEKFARTPVREKGKKFLSASDVQRYEKELRDKERSLKAGESGLKNGEQSKLYAPKDDVYLQPIRDRIRELHRILEKRPPKLSNPQRDMLYREMKKIEDEIRSHRPFTMNQLKCNPKNRDQVKSQGARLADQIEYLGSREVRLKNIRRQLWPDNPKAGNLDYLRRKR